MMEVTRFMHNWPHWLWICEFGLTTSVKFQPYKKWFLTRCFSLPKKLNVQLWFLPSTFCGGVWYRSAWVLFNNFELMENEGFLWGIITFIRHKHSNQNQFTGMFNVHLIYIWGDSQFAQLNCSLKRQLKTLFNFLAPTFTW